MDIDKYLYIKGKEYCTKVKFGLQNSCFDVLDNLYDAIIRKRINEASDCDSVPVVTPSVNCPPEITFIDNQTFNIGTPINADMVYGYYLFDTPKTTLIDFNVINTDIAIYPNNYILTSATDKTITLNGSTLYFPAILIPNVLTARIYDLVNADITHTFSQYTDGNNTWYVQEQVVVGGYDIKFRIELQ